MELVELKRTFEVGWALPPLLCCACISSSLNERDLSIAPQRLARCLEDGGRDWTSVWLRFSLQKSREEGGCSATGCRPLTGRDTHLEPLQLATPCNAMHAAFMVAIGDWDQLYGGLCDFLSAAAQPASCNLGAIFRVSDRPKHRSLPVGPGLACFSRPFPRPRPVVIGAIETERQLNYDTF